MNFFTLFSLIVLTSVCTATAQIPKKAPPTRYAALWTKSPFTSTPAPAAVEEKDNPISDYTLTGIAQIPSGYRITIVNKKNNTIKEVIETGDKSEFKIISVDRNLEKSLGTKVTLRKGTFTGVVTFEPDLITPKAAPKAAPPKVLSNKKGQPIRPPRPRIVAPPNSPALKKQLEALKKSNGAGNR